MTADYCQLYINDRCRSLLIDEARRGRARTCVSDSGRGHGHGIAPLSSLGRTCPVDVKFNRRRAAGANRRRRILRKLNSTSASHPPSAHQPGDPVADPATLSASPKAGSPAGRLIRRQRGCDPPPRSEVEYHRTRKVIHTVRDADALRPEVKFTVRQGHPTHSELEPKTPRSARSPRPGNAPVPDRRHRGSSSRRGFHPPALTEPCVTVSRYTALVVLVTRRAGSRSPRPSGRRTSAATSRPAPTEPGPS